MGYVRSWQMRKAIKTGKTVEAIDNNYILGALVGTVVFALGVWWLESDSAPANATYSPAKIENGTLTGGGFEQPK
jgi:formate/nitrite transporter FocA (FNT family)